jgi:dTDP-4-dehydrorhamnose reductase
MAMLVNALAPGWMAQAAARHDAVVIHYSTDYVFRGDQDGAYVETDPVGPLSVYGKTKLAGEQAVAAACPRHLIFRTSWVFDADGSNFLKTMLRLARERDALNVVADQFGAPTSANLIAETTAHVLSQMIHAPASDPRWGVYHLVAAGETNWHEYASYVIDRARQSGVPIRVRQDALSKIATKDYPLPAPRPHNSRMNTTKLRETFGVSMPDWHVGVDQVLAQILKGDGCVS